MARRAFGITLVILVCGLALWLGVQWFDTRPLPVETATRSCPPASDNTYYFPVDTFGQFFPEEFRRKGSDSRHREWYSAQFRAMEEPSLSCGDAGEAESYRFLWLRSFNQPIAVRVRHTSARTVLVAVALVGGPPNGSGPSEVERKIEKELTPVEWKRIETAVERITLWRLPTEDGSPPGTDGSRWIVEGRSSADHHVVDRWNGGNLKDFGLMMLELSGLEIPEGDVY